MTIRKLRQRLAYWQEVLKLTEWTITVKFGTPEEMMDESGHRCHGLNFISVEELSSQIFLDRGDGEETLIHELLHVVFDGHRPQDEPYDPLHERAINRTAAAFMTISQQE